MQRRNLLLIIGISFLAVGILVAVVFVLRSRNQVQDLPALVTPASQGSSQKAVVAPVEGFTPAEQQTRDALLQNIQSAPQDIRSTWTPEFAAQMDANSTTRPSTPTH